MRYRIVDVFADRPLSGNALCVVVDPCPASRMGAVAREVNLSETTFPTITGEGTYSMRIFTPGVEIPFAGHPTLGTAWVLGPGRWRQTTPGATVTVEVTAAGAVMSQPDPVITEVDPDRVDVALGLPGIEGAFLSVAGGTAHVLVPTTYPLEDLGPELESVKRVAARAGGISLCPFRRLDDRTLHVRAFVPGAGVPEDPGTGSAAGPIALLARRRWGTDVDVVIRQGDEIGRPCRIDAHAEEGAIRVGGRVTDCAEGNFVAFGDDASLS